MLQDICILDLTNDQGSFCSKLLADLGAHVIRFEGADEESLQEDETYNPAEQESLRASLSFIYHNTNKLIVASEPDSRKRKHALHRLIERADVLIENLPPARLEALSLGNRLLHRMNPRLIHLSITGFGRTGPKRSFLYSDSVASAFGGQMFLSGSRPGPPVKLAGRQSFYAASLFGANAILLCLRKRKLTGKGCHIDLSIQESVASTLDHVMIRYFHNAKIAGRDKDIQLRSPFAVLHCGDGYIQVPTLQNWETLLQLMDTEGKAGNLFKAKWQKEAYRGKHVTQINQVVAEWTKNHRKRELFGLGQAMRLPWAPVSSLRDVLESPQLKARRFFIGTKSQGNKSRIVVPGSPYKFSGSALPSLKRAPIWCGQVRQAMEGLGAAGVGGVSKRVKGADSKHLSKSSSTLRGIRVLDLTRMLSGPYATRILGDFGAEVIKVQSRMTAKGAERNDTPYFGSWNRNKRSVCLNLNHPEARKLFLALTAISDIVVENYSPRVLANWRLTYRQLKRAKPDLIMASISAMGQSGPWKDFVGFAPTFHALSGLMSATSRNLDSPINVGHAYADVIAGLYAAMAILASLEYRDRTGEGQYIDLSAYEAACTLLGPELMEADLERMQANRPKSSEGCGKTAICGCYPCRGVDRWCVIVVSSEKQWRAFCRISGKSELSAGRFATASKRRKNRSELDTLISDWTSTNAAETVVRRLQRNGIAAGVVQDAEDLARDRQLAARRFFVSLDHPILGKSYSDRSALWPWRERPDWKAAPQLGEDNRYVFTELLGCSNAQLRSLIKKGVVR